jgi:hypothetical protein
VKRTKKQEVIDAKYNELCSAVDSVDWKLREFTRLYDPQIDNLYLKTKALHDMLIEIHQQLDNYD